MCARGEGMCARGEGMCALRGKCVSSEGNERAWCGMWARGGE